MFCEQLAWNNKPNLETSKTNSTFLAKYLAKRGWLKYRQFIIIHSSAQSWSIRQILSERKSCSKSNHSARVNCSPVVNVGSFVSAFSGFQNLPAPPCLFFFFAKLDVDYDVIQWVGRFQNTVFREFWDRSDWEVACNAYSGLICSVQREISLWYMGLHIGTHCQKKWSKNLNLEHFLFKPLTKISTLNPVKEATKNIFQTFFSQDDYRILNW